MTSNIANQPRYYWKNPRYILQKPLTNVTLVPDAHPELSAIPFLKDLDRFAEKSVIDKDQATFNFTLRSPRMPDLLHESDLAFLTESDLSTALQQ